MDEFKKICAEIVEQVIEGFCDDRSPPATEDNINEAERPEAEKKVQTAEKETLFYIHMHTICPIFMKQPMSLTKGRVVIHCVRHAEAEHNIRQNPHRWSIIDPNLTERGKIQASHLETTFTAMPNITHILASPLRRTMGTALLAFKPLLSQGLKIVAYPDLREVGTGPASTGSSVEDIKVMLPEKHQISDTSLVPEGWEKNRQDTSAHIKLRSNRVRRELWELGQQALKESDGKWKGYDVSRGSTHENIEIVVVSHGGFLRRMLGLKHELYNAEWKSFEFAGGSSKEKAEGGQHRYELLETEESKMRCHNQYI